MHSWIKILTQLCAFLFLALIFIASGRRFQANSQQSPAPEIGVNVPERSRDILAHLDSVIQFYRASTQPIQRAGEPNDVVYRDQAVTQSTQIAAFAFQSARAEAALLAKSTNQTGGQPESATSNEQQRMQAAESNVENRIDDLRTREEALEKKTATAKPRDVAALEAQKNQIAESLKLSEAMKDALQKIVEMRGVAGGSGLAGDIDRLQRSVPELESTNKTPAPQLTMLSQSQSAGVTSQGSVLFQLFETKHSLHSLLQENASVQKQALALRAPLSTILRGLIQRGQQLAQAPTDTSSAPEIHTPSPASTPATLSTPDKRPIANHDDLKDITTEFKTLSAATVPLSQEIIMLDQSRANLEAWESSVNAEYAALLHALLLRVLVIAIALLCIFGGGELWSRATNKYVHDLRRRRQFLIVRRVVVGFLSVIVLVFGFVTQFNSLATFAGFITAGIAVGLQTMLLSVAAYFFIIGRYGIKVGDRITIASVTGDVVDVGLVRFYLMELAGSGTSLSPTGRIAVFSNAVLFQAGTPLYKQIPGTDYAWHELIIKLNDSADYKMVCDSVMRAVRTVYEGYRANIEQQHRGAESWMQTRIDSPDIEARLQFAGSAFQLWIRFPVEILHAQETDDNVIRALLELMSKSAEVKAGVGATPTIQASVRG